MGVQRGLGETLLVVLQSCLKSWGNTLKSCETEGNTLKLCKTAENALKSCETAGNTPN